VEAGFALVVAAGGDGTVAAAAGPLVGSTTNLGILPVGTSNNFAMSLRIPAALERSVQTVLGPNQVKLVDVARVNDTYSLVAAGAGFDARLILDTSPGLKRFAGRWAYVASAIKNGLLGPAGEFTIEADGQTVRTVALSAMVANVGRLGWRWISLGPAISCEDGKLDVCVFSPRGIEQKLAMAARLILKRYCGATYMTYIKAREVSIECSPIAPVQSDGDFIGTTPLRAFVVPSALRVIVPLDVTI
jgi:diacylglycerol kinase (ATP)